MKRGSARANVVTFQLKLEPPINNNNNASIAGGILGDRYPFLDKKLPWACSELYLRELRRGEGED